MKRWLEVRLGDCYPQLDGMVVDQSGNILPNDALVAEARGACETRSDLVLRFTATVTSKQSETQEQRLRELAKMLVELPCIHRSEVSRPRILPGWHRRLRLVALTRPLTLRYYEVEIVADILNQLAKSRAFESEIDRDWNDPPNISAFHSTDLNRLAEFL
ncbi:hypothetical protein [Haloferula sp. A504]|uniref:hypothetical protein n=1 Tax=Haloferula sp. A504 TaxID=3373601 RepID=UPI0031C602A1|nr:hypothetical protein [Verrucomicrobiaceae bacterium E54]